MFPSPGCVGQTHKTLLEALFKIPVGTNAGRLLFSKYAMSSFFFFFLPNHPHKCRLKLVSCLQHPQAGNCLQNTLTPKGEQTSLSWLMHCEAFGWWVIDGVPGRSWAGGRPWHAPSSPMSALGTGKPGPSEEGPRLGSCSSLWHTRSIPLKPLPTDLLLGATRDDHRVEKKRCRYEEEHLSCFPCLILQKLLFRFPW